MFDLCVVGDEILSIIIQSMHYSRVQPFSQAPAMLPEIFEHRNETFRTALCFVLYPDKMGQGRCYLL